MDQKEVNEKAETGKGKKEEEESPPFCTTAPSAEHARAENDDEPCDDGRKGP